MISPKISVPVPPWGAVADWQEANRCIDLHVSCNQTKLKPAVTLAEGLRHRLESILPLLDDLCAKTCPLCPEPCCLIASPWYDLRDLIFLHLNHLAIPLAQPIDNYQAVCCYAGSNGCTLPRIIRPWICTWYLCPVQKANLNKNDVHQWMRFDRSIQEIKVARKQLEEEYIRIVVK
jgi:hypothetical protein